jgi:hypothetical protein
MLIEHADAVHLHEPPAFRSVYLDHVGQIAPERLEDRDRELNDLAAFCLDPGQGPYAWWQASAFAGKSALMAWFALHPPPGVRVVCFFVTARIKDENNREAFIGALLSQLAELLGEPVPAADPWANSRIAHLFRMLGAAAQRVAAAGERLVLLVDGLDEDRGVTTNPDEAYSIAALLPPRPPAELRVIVSGRPSPPLPNDVSQGHPLRDPNIVRRLTQSPRAAAVRELMERELQRLLHGSKLEKGVTAFIAAAGGGLSAADLAELSGAPDYRVEGLLTTVAGRSFTARESVWRYGLAPRVYVLGHEELQTMAATSLGRERLAKCRKKLHAWATSYRRRAWPEDTPEYLLRGYFRLLQETDDMDRLVACSTDWRRQDRLIQLAGGVGAVLSEITAVQERLLRSAAPDLPLIARLAAHRAILGGGHANFPVLPQVWAMFGYWDRAATASEAIADPDERAQCLTELARLAAEEGDLNWARKLAAQAETSALAAADPQDRSRVLTELARAMAAADDLDRTRACIRQAETAASAISDPRTGHARSPHLRSPRRH